jgi:hypothetical protein
MVIGSQFNDRSSIAGWLARSCNSSSIGAPPASVEPDKHIIADVYQIKQRTVDSDS